MCRQVNFPKFNKRVGWNKSVQVGKFGKMNKVLLHNYSAGQSMYFFKKKTLHMFLVSTMATQSQWWPYSYFVGINQVLQICSFDMK